MDIWLREEAGGENTEAWERVRVVVNSWVAAWKSEVGSPDRAMLELEVSSLLEYVVNDPQNRLGNVVADLARLAAMLAGALSKVAEDTMTPEQFVDQVIDSILGESKPDDA